MSKKPSPALRRAIDLAARASTPQELAQLARVPYRLALIAFRKNLSARK